jgi:hypothetical protein
MKTYVLGPVKYTCMKKPGTLKGALATILTKTNICFGNW